MNFTHVTKMEKVICYSASQNKSQWLMSCGVKLKFSDPENVSSTPVMKIEGSDHRVYKQNSPRAHSQKPYIPKKKCSPLGEK